MITNSTENQYQYKKYLIENDPNFKIRIEMRDTEDPIVTLLEPNGVSRTIEHTQDDIMRNGLGKQIANSAGGALVGLLNIVTSAL